MFPCEPRVPSPESRVTIPPVLLVVAVSLLLLVDVQTSACADVPSCRSEAEAAAARGDFESFHDLAWRTVQKGKPNDPELMLLLARAQSRSGRPGDAVVMLQRLARLGVRTDAATSDDFARVRAMPSWPEIQATLANASEPAAASAAISSSPAASAADARRAPPAKSSEAAATTAAPASAPAVSSAAAAATDDEALPSPFDTIEPAGLAYDAVSRRFIVGDRRSHKLVIFDEVFKRATDMIRPASSGFFGIAAMEIDSRRGDLWVANSSASGGASVTKLQLVSGRVLFEVPVPTALGPASFADAAVLPDGTLLLLDGDGRRLLRIAPGTREFLPLGAVDAESPVSVAVLAGYAYVAHAQGLSRVSLEGGSATPVRGAPAGLLRVRAGRGGLVGVQSADGVLKVVSLRLRQNGQAVGSMEVLDDRAAMTGPAALTVVDGAVCYIAAGDGGPVMRRIKPDGPRRGAPRR